MLGNLFEPCRPAVRKHKVCLGDPQFLLFLLRFHDCMDLRTYRCKNRSARCLITCRGSLQSGARQAARPTSAPRRLRPLRRRAVAEVSPWDRLAPASRHQTVPSGRASHRPTVGRAASPALIILIVIVAILPFVSHRLRHKVLANLIVDIRFVSLA